MSKTNNLGDYLKDLYRGIALRNPNASKNPQDFRQEIENLPGAGQSGSIRYTEYDGVCKVSGVATEEDHLETLYEYDGKCKVSGIPQEEVIEGYVKPPSGSLTITENGEHDVTEYEKVMVSVEMDEGFIKPSGTLPITENGKHNVTAYAEVDVEVKSDDTALDALIDGSITEINSDATKIESYAFYTRKQLISANFPNAESAGSHVFYGCSALKSVSMPQANSISGSTFANCTSLETVEASSALIINNYAFQKCTALYKLDLPLAYRIGGYSFDGSRNLKVLILRRADKVCELTGTLKDTSISTSGYIYVPRSLKEEYLESTNWSNYGPRFRAIEDYPEICGG